MRRRSASPASLPKLFKPLVTPAALGAKPSRTLPHPTPIPLAFRAASKKRERIDELSQSSPLTPQQGRQERAT